MSSPLLSAYSSDFSNNCCPDRFFFLLFALFLDNIHTCMQFVLIIFTHPSLTLSDSLETPFSSQRALLILRRGYGLLSLTRLFA